MSMETPLGLFGFPVTKCCMVTTVAIPILASVLNTKYLFVLSFDPFISEYHQYYRFLLFQLAAVNESDVALLVLIWYMFRHLERLMGSYKYISVISLTYIYTTFILTTFSIFLNGIFDLTLWNRFPTGGLPIVMVLFHFFKEYTPHIYEFDVLLAQPLRLLGSSSSKMNQQLKWRLTDHFFVSTLIILLLINQGWPGISCGFISWICGIFMDKGLLPGANRWRLPWIHRYLAGPNIKRQADVSRTGINALSGGGEGSEDVLSGQFAQDTTFTAATDNNGPEDNDEPVRPLGVQFLDTFRR